jgi:hypothetical protein
MGEEATGAAPAQDTGQGPAPTPPPSTGEQMEAQVQSAESFDQGQSSGGQGLIEPFLEGVDANVRPVLEQKLNEFRSSQDAQVNRKLEQLATYEKYGTPEEIELPVAFYEEAVENPVKAVEWLSDQFSQHFGRDLRSELRQWLDGQQPGQQQMQGQQQPGAQQLPNAGDPNDPNRPMTRAEFESYMQEQQQAQQQAQLEQQRQQQMVETTNQWVDGAAQKYNLELAEGDPLRSTILLQAAQLHNAGQARGQDAVDLATKAVVDRLRAMNGAPPPSATQHPKVAEGGGRPTPDAPDFSDSNARQEAMLAAFNANANH